LFKSVAAFVVTENVVDDATAATCGQTSCACPKGGTYESQGKDATGFGVVAFSHCANDTGSIDGTIGAIRTTGQLIDTTYALEVTVNGETVTLSAFAHDGAQQTDTTLSITLDSGVFIVGSTSAGAATIRDKAGLWTCDDASTYSTGRCTMGPTTVAYGN